ncbi:MAG: hypothetical protein LUG18_01395 [Candidatus Azobacteroides sp.]|nr:hypothetical protein [Candidatus Azobacteroides sp.]
MKKVVTVIAAFLLLGYVVFAISRFSSKPAEEICRGVEVQVLDSASIKFITSGDIRSFLSENGLYPLGKKVNDINTEQIEQKLKTIPIIEKAKCYFTPTGTLYVDIVQRKPIMRILGNSESYYIDEEAKIIPLSSNFNVFLPIATGNIDTVYAQTDLHQFALYLHKNPFWNAQIEQIDVLTNRDVILIPRVGEHQILFGKLENIEDKLDQLLVFYKKGLSETGWNKYDQINLKYKGQIVCTKRE